MAVFNFLKKKQPAAKKLEKKAEITMPAGRQVKKAPLRKKEGASYKLLKEPHVSEKATYLEDKDQYVFKAYDRANKPEIKKAIESLYGVAVKNVNIINIKTKQRVLRGMKGKKSGYKKAIVTLEKGHKIEILPH